MEAKEEASLSGDHRWDFGILRVLRKQRQWSIADLSERAEVASSVISKLERNCTKSELETLYRLAQAFSMDLSDLLALAEKRTAQRTEGEQYEVSGFRFSRVSYRNMRCMRATAAAGAVLSRPAIHQEDWEV